MSPEDAKKEISDYVRMQIDNSIFELRKKGILCDWNGRIEFDFSDEDINRYLKNKEDENARKVSLIRRFLDIF